MVPGIYERNGRCGNSFGRFLTHMWASTRKALQLCHNVVMEALWEEYLLNPLVHQGSALKHAKVSSIPAKTLELCPFCRSDNCFLALSGMHWRRRRRMEAFWLFLVNLQSRNGSCAKVGCMFKLNASSAWVQVTNVTLVGKIYWMGSASLTAESVTSACVSSASLSM